MRFSTDEHRAVSVMKHVVTDAAEQGTSDGSHTPGTSHYKGGVLLISRVHDRFAGSGTEHSHNFSLNL